MPLARRLSNSSREAFSDFCNKNQPLSRRLSSNGDASSVSSSNRRDSIVNERGHRILKRRNQSRNLAKAGTRRPSLHKGPVNISSPEPKKRRTTRNGSPANANKENDGGDDNQTGLMMSPTPYWKVNRL